MTWEASPWEVVEGDTAAIEFRLSDENGPIAINGYVPGAATNGIFLAIRDHNGQLVNTTGKLTVIDDGVTPALKGRVNFLPNSSDFVNKKSGYTARFRLVDNVGLVTSIPRSVDPDTILVGLVA